MKFYDCNADNCAIALLLPSNRRLPVCKAKRIEPVSDLKRLEKRLQKELAEIRSELNSNR